jgi:hypothetical protein
MALPRPRSGVASRPSHYTEIKPFFSVRYAFVCCIQLTCPHRENSISWSLYQTIRDCIVASIPWIVSAFGCAHIARIRYLGPCTKPSETASCIHSLDRQSGKNHPTTCLGRHYNIYGRCLQTVLAQVYCPTIGYSMGSHLLNYFFLRVEETTTCV